MAMNIGVLICAFNEAKHIKSLVADTKKIINNILVVDDGSIDQTTEYSLTSGAKVIRIKKNKGKGYALRTGFRYFMNTNTEYIITMDADGQHNPREIPKFIHELKKIHTNFHCPKLLILGSRFRNKKPPLGLRTISNLITSFIISKLFRVKITDSQTGFRLISSALLKNIKLTKDRFDLETELLLQAIRSKALIKEIDIDYVEPLISRYKKLSDSLRIAQVIIKTLLH